MIWPEHNSNTHTQKTLIISTIIIYKELKIHIIVKHTKENQDLRVLPQKKDYLEMQNIELDKHAGLLLHNRKEKPKVV